jgi:hypothetical protein
MEKSYPVYNVGKIFCKEAGSLQPAMQWDMESKWINQDGPERSLIQSLRILTLHGKKEMYPTSIGTCCGWCVQVTDFKHEEALLGNDDAHPSESFKDAY